MNLLQNARIKRHWPESGKLVPGTNCFEQLPTQWSPPQVQVYEDHRVGWVMNAVNTLLSRPDIHVVAVSPAAVAATPEIGRHSGAPTGVWEPYFALTVIYQERVKPPTQQPEPATHGDIFPAPDFAPGDSEQRELVELQF